MHRLAKAIALLATCFYTAQFTLAGNIDSFGSGANQFDIEFVPIGEPGNLPDPDDGSQFQSGDQNLGAVAYPYRISKFEISEEMIDKANNIAGLGLDHDGRGPNKPATAVSWFEAAKFVNWLNTSNGHHVAYDFNGDFIQLWDPANAWQAGGQNRYLPSQGRFLFLAKRR